jgi:cytosine/adenosine deaminase-related metal-dependent hydrolase
VLALGACRTSTPQASSRSVSHPPDASATVPAAEPDGAPGPPADETDARDAGAETPAGDSPEADAGVFPEPPEPQPPYRVVSCPDAWKVDLLPQCAAAGSSALGVRIRATILAPGVLYRDGELWIDERGTIGCVGCDCGDVARPGALVITCPESVVSPGLVNPHDHISYAGTPPVAHVERYDHRHDWRLGIRGHEALSYRGSASEAEVLAHELRMVMSGVTAAVSAGGRRGLLRNLDDQRLSEGLRAGLVAAAAFPLDDSAGLLVSAGCDYGRYPDGAAYAAGFAGYLPHIGEGVDAPARNELACSRDAFGLIAANTAVVHALASDARAAAALRAERASVVWSPRSNVDLYGNTAPISLLHRSGVRLALGTDWLASGSMNMLRELACARSLNTAYFGSILSDYDLWNMVTFNAAFAAGVERALGRLEVGWMGDVALFDASKATDFAAVVAAEPAGVQLVLRAGAPLYGDAHLVASFSTSAVCEGISVCGADKRACVLGDTGLALARLQEVADRVYPLFFCDTPRAEPSCLPARPGEYTGLPSAADRDGDGVPDALDLCPDVFDPVRPLDGTVQADADHDGLGDACDPCPLDANNDCRAPSPYDLDGDGVPDVVDNCPRRANGDQADADGDGHGDACDGCAAPNPGATPCLLPIAALRDPDHPARPPLRSAVELSSVYVTALRPNSGSSRGFYVQERSLEPYSGLFVYTAGQAPGVGVGSRVSLRGYFDRYLELDELIEPLISVETSPGPLPFAPVLVLPEHVADGGLLAKSHISMLVAVENVTVLNPNPDAPNDYDEFSVTGHLRIDDWLYPDLDNVYLEGQPFSAISGILGFSFGHQKLWPTSSSDLRP